MDSGVDTEYTSDLESVTSSNYEFRRQGRRRYHGIDSPYALPNDDEEKVRLDELQFCVRSLLGANVLAPITPNPTQIVDVGTGSGKWVIEVAEEFPSARVFGTDISPVQDTDVPVNAEFILMDLNDGLEFDDGSTDLVHSRLVHGGISESQWPPYMKEIYRILKPGNGWAQCIELFFPYCLSDENVPQDIGLKQLFRNIEQHYSTQGFRLVGGDKLEQLMRDAGFVDIKEKVVRVEVGGKGPVGRACVYVWSEAMVGNAESLAEFYPNDEERSAFSEKVKLDVRNPAYKWYSYLYVVTGRKPGIDLDTGKEN